MIISPSVAAGLIEHTANTDPCMPRAIGTTTLQNK